VNIDSAPTGGLSSENFVLDGQKPIREVRVTLINAPIDIGRVLGAGSVLTDPGEPSGILYVASYLRKHNPNVRVSIIDSFQRNWSVERTFQELVLLKPDIVGISCVTANGSEAFRLGKKVRKEMGETLVIMGNVHPTYFKEVYLNNGACDLIVRDEGEATASEIVSKFCSEGSRGDYSDVKGIFFYKDGEIVGTPPREMLDVNTIPFPARDLIDVRQYPAYKEGVCVIHGSRGCTFRCNFCSLHQRKYRYRSADDIIAEVIHCKETYGYSYFLFFDPLFGGNKAQTNEFCEKMIATGLNKEVRWSCEVHVNLIKNDTLKLWKEAGLVDVALGLESGNDEVLRIANKSSKVETIRNAVQIVHDMKLRVWGLFILGLPGDTAETIEQTIRFARELPIDNVHFSTFTPYPGSQFYNDLMAKGYFNHIDMSDLDQVLPWWDRFSAYTAFTDNLYPIYTPDGITPEQLKTFQRKAFRTFYSTPSRALKRVKVFGVRKVLQELKPALKLFRRVKGQYPQTGKATLTPSATS